MRTKIINDFKINDIEDDNFINIYWFKSQQKYKWTGQHLIIEILLLGGFFYNTRFTELKWVRLKRK